MDISKIDKNLKVESSIERENLVWFDASEAPFTIYGAYNTNPYIRMPQSVAENTNDGVKGLNFHTAGIRVRFCTDSPFIAIKAEWQTQTKMPHMPFTGMSGFDLYRCHQGTQQYVKTFIPPVESPNGFESIADINYGFCDYLINFPLYNSVKKLYIGLSTDAVIEKTAGYKYDKPVVFYGSSITQGGCASRPGNSYQSLLSQRLDFDFINLGFSGSARGEDATAEYMAGLDMSVFVSDYDHNAPTVEHLENTHYKLYETIRSKNPDLPYIMLSKPDINLLDYAPSDKIGDGTLRRSIIFKSYQKALENGDKNVYFIDGASIFDSDFYDACTVDGCHPNDLGFYFFSKALYPLLKKILHK